jgi:hypothetical protein
MKVRSRVFLLTFLLIAVLCPERKLKASSRYDPPVCEAFNWAKTVFVGRVVNATQKRENVYDDETDESSVYCSLELAFEVIESFSGAPSRFVTVWESGGENCEDLGYSPGEVYLVYAYGEEDGKLWAGDRTRSLGRVPFIPFDNEWSQQNYRATLKEYDEELKFLRGASREILSGARVFGFVRSSRNAPGRDVKDFTEYVAGVTIKIENDQRSLEVKTGADGKYEIQGLEPGVYRITAAPPEGFVPVRSLRWRDFSKSWDKELSLRNCGCVNFVFEIDPVAMVNGRVIDAEGKPMAGVAVSLISERWREEAEIKDGDIKSYQTLDSKTDEYGRYKIEKVAPGRYLLGVNVIRPTPQSPYPRVFYPDVSDVKQAEVITVEPGKVAGQFDLRLTNKLEKHKIQGIVVWPDDTPVVGARIMLLHPDERLRRGYDATTDERGRFTIEGLKDYEYKVRVYWRDDESSASEEEKMKFTGDVKDLKIMLSQQ